MPSRRWAVRNAIGGTMWSRGRMIEEDMGTLVAERWAAGLRLPGTRCRAVLSEPILMGHIPIRRICLIGQRCSNERDASGPGEPGRTDAALVQADLGFSDDFGPAGQFLLQLRGCNLG
jgi:hypothetical protein